MKPMLVLARHEIRMARRERLSRALLVAFLGMTLISGFIGWSTHRTVIAIYRAALSSTGATGTNPFLASSPLENIKNTIVYIALIGALLAIVVGVRSSVRDRRAGTTDLLLSRPISPRAFLLGKLLGTQAWIGMVLLVALVVSWADVALVSGHPPGSSDSLAMTQTFAIAWIFLLPFCVVGHLAGFASRQESNALLVPILVWIAATFIIPQLGTAQNPVSLLNPVPGPSSIDGAFFRFNRAVLRPISFTEHFRHASAVTLGLRDAAPGGIGGDLASIGGAGLTSLLALASSTRTLRRPIDE